MDFLLAVHALVLLTHRNQALSSAQIAANACSNPVQVRRALAGCVRAGLVCCAPGKRGGYTLARDPETITLEEVATATGTSFLKAIAATGDVDASCLISSGMANLSAALNQELTAAVEAVLAGRTIADCEQQLIHGNQVAATLIP